MKNLFLLIYFQNNYSNYSDAFPFDITANGLPTLWGGAGWVPMYAWDSERNKKNFIKDTFYDLIIWPKMENRLNVRVITEPSFSST